jgi:hypothetical protein
MLTVFTLGLGARRGRHLGPTSSLSPPSQPNNEVDCRAMLRELLLLAVVIALIIAGILIQLCAEGLRHLPLVIAQQLSLS